MGRPTFRATRGGKTVKVPRVKGSYSKGGVWKSRPRGGKRF